MTDHAAVAHADEHHYTSTDVPTWKLGFWTFIGSECLFFGSLIATYMVYKGESVVGPYPHGPEGILSIPLTSVSTFVLLMSSLAMVLALDAVQRGNRKGSLVWIMAVAVLGATFLGFQAYEFTHFYHAGLSLSTNLFGASFFVLTGFHGAHVTVGVMWLLALWFLALRDRLPPADALKVEITGLYWHFVDVVWIVIFTLVYLIE
ncbi:MAG: cytochrome c oxidase subunit 3 [Longimicrobiales bacterium]